jgi:hypothetical protein
MTGTSLHKLIRQMSLKSLRELLPAVTSRIEELESLSVRREIDIASEHTGETKLIHTVVKTIGDPTTGRWKQIEKILRPFTAICFRTFTNGPVALGTSALCCRTA